jgi:hypothetical protein
MAKKKRVPKGIHPLIVKYRARLDAAWRKKVHEVGGGKCFISGETKLVNAHHIIDRRCYTSRWIILNGVLLSPIYHKFGSKAIHNNPLFVLERWAVHISMLGWPELNELASNAKSIHELTEDEQAKIVLSALKELRPDLYEKEIKSV